MPGPTPQVIELANAFRAQLLARESASAAAMTRFYGETWRRLQPDIVALRAEIESARDAGEEISEGRIWRLERMQAIQAQAERELGVFSQFAGDTITGGQRESMAAGERNAHDLLLGMFPPGSINISFAAMPRDAVETIAGFLQDGSPLQDVIAKYAADSVQGFAETMVTGMAAGWNPRRLARELRDAFGVGLGEALRISRTEQLRAYRAATLNAYRNSDGIVTAWERMAAIDIRTCLACIMLDGTVYELEDEMEDHPNGRCAILPITKSYAELGINAPEPNFQREQGEDWFRRQPDAVQQDMMGTGKWNAWQDGHFELKDLPHQITSSVWGNSWVPAPLYKLLGEPGPVGTYQQWLATPGAEAVSLFSPSTEAQAAARNYAQQQIDSLAQKLGVSAQEITAEIMSKLHDDLGQPLAIRTSGNRINDILESGQFKTQFETGTSGGVFNLDAREQAEFLGLGAPRDLDASERPVYAYVRTNEHNAGVYGRTEWILRDDVKNRSTITLGDSFQPFDRSQAVGVSIPDPNSSGWDGFVEGYHEGGAARIQYIEAQIQGGVGLNDVARVVIHERRPDIDSPFGRIQMERIQRMIDALERAGLEVAWDDETN